MLSLLNIKFWHSACHAHCLFHSWYNGTVKSKGHDLSSWPAISYFFFFKWVSRKCARWPKERVQKSKPSRVKSTLPIMFTLNIICNQPQDQPITEWSSLLGLNANLTIDGGLKVWKTTIITISYWGLTELTNPSIIISLTPLKISTRLWS